MTLAAATKYAADHAQMIKASLRSRRAPGGRYTADGVTVPAVDGVTPRVEVCDYTGGRDPAAPKGNRRWSPRLRAWVLRDGHGARVEVETPDGSYRVHEGYHDGNPKDGWKARVTAAPERGGR